MKFYTGARVRWLSNSHEHGLNLRDEGEITAMFDEEWAWVKFDKLEASVYIPLRKLIRVIDKQ